MSNQVDCCHHTCLLACARALARISSNICAQANGRAARRKLICTYASELPAKLQHVSLMTRICLARLLPVSARGWPAVINMHSLACVCVRVCVRAHSRHVDDERSGSCSCTQILSIYSSACLYKRALNCVSKRPPSAAGQLKHQESLLLRMRASARLRLYICFARGAKRRTMIVTVCWLAQANSFAWRLNWRALDAPDALESRIQVACGSCGPNRSYIVRARAKHQSRDMAARTGAPFVCVRASVRACALARTLACVCCNTFNLPASSNRFAQLTGSACH